MPTILQPIAAELGVTVGKLKELGAQGLITSDVVIRALQKIQSEGGGKIAGIITQSDLQVFKNFNNALEDLRKTVGEALNPVILPLTKNITNLINAFNDANPIFQKAAVLVGAVATAALLAAPVLGTFALVMKGLGLFFTSSAGVALLGFFSLANLPLIGLVAGLTAAFTGLAVQIGKVNEKRRAFQDKLDSGNLKVLEEAKSTELNTIAQLENSNARGMATKGIQRQIKEAQERIALIDKEIERLGILNKTYTIGGIEYDSNMVPINPPKTGFEEPPKSEKGKGTPLLDALQREQQFLKDALTMGTAKAKLEERIRDLMKEQNGLSEEQARKQVLLADADQKRLALQEQIKDVLAQGMTDAVMGLIEGTKTLGEALASIAKQLAGMFLKQAFTSIFSGMFSEQGSYSRAGGFKAFQYGGVVNKPTLGLMGEGGEPEYVIPSSKMDGAMARYSAGARGGAVIPGGSHESGTVAGSTGNTIVEYTGPTLNFNGDEYVPKSAVPQIIGAATKQGAIAGKAQVLGTLRNSRSQRASLGL